LSRSDQPEIPGSFAQMGKGVYVKKKKAGGRTGKMQGKKKTLILNSQLISKKMASQGGQNDGKSRQCKTIRPGKILNIGRKGKHAKEKERLWQNNSGKRHAFSDLFEKRR